jgi:hypothetical protein
LIRADTISDKLNLRRVWVLPPRMLRLNNPPTMLIEGPAKPGGVQRLNASQFNHNHRQRATVT